MRLLPASLVLGLGLLLAAGSAAATLHTQPNCATLAVPAPAGYTTACALTGYGWAFQGEGYDYSYEERRLLTTSEAHVLDAPNGLGLVETWGFDTLAQSEFRYADSWGGGSSTYAGDRFEASSVRALVVGERVAVGYQAGLAQENTSYEVCGDGSCWSSVQRTTTAGASAYVSTRAGPGVGVGTYYVQQGDGQNACAESANAQLSGGSLFYEFVPLVEGQPCAHALPWANEHLAFPTGPAILPPLDA
jgi:hypothetical protein